MTNSKPSSLAGQLKSLPRAERDALIDSLSTEQAYTFKYDWEGWARPNQLPPELFALAHRAIWLILAGRGYGKTRVGAEQTRTWIKAGFNYCNLIAATADDLRDVLVEGESGILAVCPKDERPDYLVSKRRLEWPNGARSLLFTAQEPDRLRGKQHQKLWADELAAWQYEEESWDQAQFGLRLGTAPQAIITTTPRPTKLIRSLMAEEKERVTETSINGLIEKTIHKARVCVTRGTTYENRSNLAETFYTSIIKRYENTRLGRQELLAEVLDDNPGALWHLSNIEKTRVHLGEKVPPLVRIVVALDPAVTSNEDSDEWGIVAVGMDARDPAHFYPLKDMSGIYTPREASKVAVTLYHELGADRVIGEANNGGDMIEALLRYQDTNVAYRKVTASRGKVIRAEPVAALYEQERCHHDGMLAKLEDELVGWSPQTDDVSPNRLDALVWAITELASGTDGWIGYARSEVKAMEDKGLVKRTEERINVAGENRDICECGCTFWITIAGNEQCLKCQAPRPR